MPKVIELSTTSHRTLPAGVLAVVASRGTSHGPIPALHGEGVPTVPPADAELGRLAAELVTLEVQADVLRGEVARHRGFPEAHGISDRRLRAVLAQMDGLRDKAASIQAVTRDGLVAKAQIVEAHWGGPMEQTEHVAWSLVCDLLGRPA